MQVISIYKQADNLRLCCAVISSVYHLIGEAEIALTSWWWSVSVLLGKAGCGLSSSEISVHSKWRLRGLYKGAVGGGWISWCSAASKDSVFVKGKRKVETETDLKSTRRGKWNLPLRPSMSWPQHWISSGLCLWCQRVARHFLQPDSPSGRKRVFSTVSSALCRGFWGHTKETILKYFERSDSEFPLWVPLWYTGFNPAFNDYVHVTSSGVLPESNQTNVFILFYIEFK